MPKTRKKRPKRPLPEYLTQEEVRRLFRAIEDPMHAALFRVIYYYGLRAHEAAKIELRDFRDARVATPKLHVRRGKGSDDSDFRPPDECLRYLRAWVAIRGKEPGPLFPGQRGAIGRWQVWNLFQRYCAAAGIEAKKAHPHVLKHSCCTHMLEQGEKITDVQAHVGHRSINNTMIYSHITDPMVQAREKRLRSW